MTKADIIAQIHERTQIDKGDVAATLEAFFKVVKNNMAEGENIYIRGFGSFVIKKRKRKIARNISQNQPMEIKEHYVPDFKPSKFFVQKVKESDRVRYRMEAQELSGGQSSATEAGADVETN